MCYNFTYGSSGKSSMRSSWKSGVWTIHVITGTFHRNFLENLDEMFPQIGVFPAAMGLR